jgi:hypothetical protein
MSDKPPGTKFLITRHYADKVPDPREVRQYLRAGGCDFLEDAVDPNAQIEQSSRTLTIPDDCAILMIGNTPELKAACQRAVGAGIDMIETKTTQPLRLHFVRIVVHPVSRQTDTLLAITSQSRWLNSNSQGWLSPTLPVWNINPPPKYISLSVPQRDDWGIDSILDHCKAEGDKDPIK